MKHLQATLLCLLLLTAFAQSAPTPDGISGNWAGTLVIGQAKLRLLVKISKTPEGLLVAKMDSLDQGARDLPADKVLFKDGTLRFEIDLIKGIYDGNLDQAGTRLVGRWIQKGSPSLPLTLERTVGNASSFPPELLSPAELAASKRAAEKLAGEWTAILKAGGDSFRLGLKITKTTTGTASATLDSLDQGLNGIPLTAISYTEGKFHFTAGGLGASYEGFSFNDNSSVTGQWHQAGQTLPLNFRKNAQKQSP